MNVLVYFSPETLSNSYVVFADGASEAILVDPRVYDVPLFTLVESRNLVVKSVLLTHASRQAAATIRALSRIYAIEVFGGSEFVDTLRITNIRNLKQFETASLTIQPITVPGNHADSLLFQIEDYLFSGDSLLAGTMAEADNSYGRALLIHQVREVCAALPATTTVLPQYGPPSTVGVEQITNIDLISNEDPGV